MFLIWRHLMFPNFEHYAKILKNQSRLYIMILIEYPGKYLPNAKIEVLAPGYYRICLLFKCQSLTKRPVLDLVANHG